MGIYMCCYENVEMIMIKSNYGIMTSWNGYEWGNRVKLKLWCGFFGEKNDKFVIKIL